MFLEKKDKRKIMAEAMFKRRHLLALEKGDEKEAQKWLDEINKLK